MSLVLGLLAVPAAGAGLTAVLPTRQRHVTTLVTTALTLALAVLTARTVLHSGEATVVVGSVGGATASLVADGLGAGLVLVSAVVALLATAFAAAQGHGDAAPGRAYWPLCLALLTGLNGVVLAGDLVTAYLLLELVAVTGAALVTLGGGRGRLAAGTRYFYAEMAASLTFLLGAALVWRAAGTVALDGIGDGALDGTEGRLGLALLTAGLLLKIPAFPMHFWMPAAHALAASTVSPWLSALVVKSAVVVLLRLWSTEPVTATATAHQLLGALGAAAVLWGGVAALRATEVKRVAAYSTVAQLGLLLLVVPLVGAGSAEGWVGGASHAIAHALPKAALLMALALLAATTGRTTVSMLAGGADRRPVAVLAIGLSAISLVGLPPSGGFVAKWYLLVGSLSTGQWWWAATVVVGGLLTAGYLGRLLHQCLQSPPEGAQDIAEGAQDTAVGAQGAAVRGVADVAALTLALLGIALGLFPEALVTLVEVGAPGGAGHG